MGTEPFAVFEKDSFEQFEEAMVGIRRRRQSEFTVFRGQGSSEWSLVPPLFRPLIEKTDLCVDDLKRAYEEEYTAVAEFVRRADRMGFVLPGKLFPFLNFVRFEKIGLEQWAIFCDSYIETIALAQHHGVATRLLDFTYDPYTALYFAAQSCFDLNQNSDEPPGHFSLWMIDAIYFHIPDSETMMIHTASAGNRYLNAQRALFVSLPSPLPNLETEDGKPTTERLDLLNEIVTDNKRIYADGPGYAHIFPVVVRFDFPAKRSADFIRKLDSRGINLMTLMPNLDNIIRHKKVRDQVNERWKHWTPHTGGEFHL
jgi:hypothetical protein